MYVSYIPTQNKIIPMNDKFVKGSKDKEKPFAGTSRKAPPKGRFSAIVYNSLCIFGNLLMLVLECSYYNTVLLLDLRALRSRSLRDLCSFMLATTPHN